jgi:hypothetical protein
LQPSPYSFLVKGKAFVRHVRLPQNKVFFEFSIRIEWFNPYQEIINSWRYGDDPPQRRNHPRRKTRLHQSAAFRGTTPVAALRHSKQRLDSSHPGFGGAPAPLRPISGPHPRITEVTPPPVDNCVFCLSVSLSVSPRPVAAVTSSEIVTDLRIRTRLVEQPPAEGMARLDQISASVIEPIPTGSAA